MTTDKTPATLATAKHGGCVQLPSLTYQKSAWMLPDDARIVGVIADNIERGKLDHPGFYRNTQLAEALRRVLDAALFAHPSPGVQDGLNYERMFVDACAALAEVSRELGCDPEQGGAEPILAAIAELREALAAHQPVGELVVTAEMLAAADAYHDSEEYRSGQFGDDHTNAACYRAMAAAARQPVRIYGCCSQPEGELHTAECPNMRHLAARQPVGDEERAETYRKGWEAGNAAQAVDLGPFRSLARSWIVEAGGTVADTKHACADELLALIDSKAVGNG